jgi:hypothetical protein
VVPFDPPQEKVAVRRELWGNFLEERVTGAAGQD